MSLTAGAKLGRYEIRSKIGEGGMGEVYRALDPKINREVAIKILPPSGGKWQVSTMGGAQPHWRSDGKELFYITPERKLMAVDVNAQQSFEVGAPKLLFQTTVARYEAPNRYAVSRDGQRFLINSAVAEVSQTMTVVLNWTAEIKR